jgi:predicted NBD/HSP70 family sugar kinase
MLAIDLGGTRIKAGLVEQGAVQDVVTVDHGAATLEQALGCLAEVIARLAPEGADRVGLCVPGTVDGGRIVALPGKLEGAVGADLVGWLQQRSRGSAFVVNDAVAYAVGEAAEEPGRTLVVTIGTGVGTCVVEDGRPLGRGPLGGGTLGGQLPLTEAGPTDTSGRAGTIEAWCRAERVGEPGYAGMLARGMAALCLAYAPDTLVIGGGGARQELVAALDLTPLLWAGQRVTVRAARHGDAAAVLGLAALA